MKIIHFSPLRSDGADIEAQAREWVIRLDGAAYGGRELAALGEWLSRSPRHRQLFHETATLWFGLDRLGAVLEQAEEARQARRRLGLRPAWALACLMVVALLLGFGYYFPASVPATEYTTAIGEVSSLALPDGSTVSLNTASRLAVSYRANARFVHLSQGEAFFQVAHDPDKPFLVYVGKYAVRAVGTAFSIQARGDSVDVLVTEGRIEVSSLAREVSDSTRLGLEPMRSATARVPLDQGQRGIFNEAADKLELVQQIPAVNLERSLSWREGMLVFENDSLERVVEKINPYMPERVVISDSNGIEGLRFGGFFPIDDIGAILSTLEEEFGIRVDRSGNELIMLSSANP